MNERFIKTNLVINLESMFTPTEEELQYNDYCNWMAEYEMEMEQQAMEAEALSENS